MEYEVTWSVMIWADSFEDAAYQVKGVLQDPGNEAWCMRVDDGTESRFLDVQYDDEPIEYQKPIRKE